MIGRHANTPNLKSLPLEMIRTVAGKQYALRNFGFLMFTYISLAAMAPQARIPVAPVSTSTQDSGLTKYDSLFNKLQLGRLGLGRRAFDYAIIGYNVLKAKNKLGNDDILSIADMTTPSGRKRLFVLDMKKGKLLFVTYVAHGRNSGLEKTLHFSNEAESNKSSVGFYITSQTYSGKHGYSMRLEGQEIGFNNNARNRDIVVHGADYVTEAVIKSQGYIGRSLGCPALSPELYKPIIEKIKNGTCLFIHGNDSKYIMNSQMLKRPMRLGKRKSSLQNPLTP
jgi:hypothetical protein